MQKKALKWLQFNQSILGVDEFILPIAKDKKQFLFKPPLFSANTIIPSQQDLRKNSFQDEDLIENILSSSSSVSNYQNLKELKEALLKFDECSFKKTARNLVFGEGNENAEILFIGEAPGQEEDKLSRPFVGRSGQLLDQMMSFIGLTRKNVFISNVIFWRPPQNRQPTAEEVAVLIPFVYRLIELIDPKIIVTLGGVSTKALLGKTEGITKLRGQFYAYPQDHNRLILPTFHPANLLRTPLNKKLAWRDFLTLKTKMAALGIGNKV